MTKQEANNLLESAPNDEQRSRINPGLTRSDALRIVRACINDASVPDPFDGLMEKRVWQVVKDRKRLAGASKEAKKWIQPFFGKADTATAASKQAKEACTPK